MTASRESSMILKMTIRPLALGRASSRLSLPGQMDEEEPKALLRHIARAKASGTRILKSTSNISRTIPTISTISSSLGNKSASPREADFTRGKDITMDIQVEFMDAIKG